MTRFLSIALLSLFSLTVQADIYSASNALSRGDYETAVKEFTRLAEKGDANAQANLGYMYYAGEGVPQNFEQAVYWYRKAATQGNRDAQYNLAVSYAFGEGVKQDLTEAAIWYRRAGEQGHVVSQYSLGISYAYGEGVPQDQKEAVRWFMKAAEQGYARAQVQLGSMYHTGEGVEQNYSEAVRWYRLAADRGDATAQYNLGTMYRSGKGVEQNYAQAKRWFRQSSDQGYAAATNELASLERTAAASIATRTIQTKPELPSVAEKTPAPSHVKETEQIKNPGEEKVLTGKTESQQVEKKITETKKEPLFSVEKEGLLSLDESELDITKKEVSPNIVKESKNEPELVEETIAKAEETDKNTPADKAIPSPIQTALGISSSEETTLAEDTDSSEGFFSKLFSKNEKTDEDTLTEATNVEEDEAVEDISPEPEVKQEVVMTPRVYPEEIKKAELAASETEEVADEVIPEDSPEEMASDETESSGGFFSRLFGNNNDSDSVEIKNTDEETVADVMEEPVEESAPEPEVKQEVVISPRVYPEEVKKAELAASETEEVADEVIPEDSTEEMATDETESSGGFFSAIGDFFTRNEKESSTAELDDHTEEEVLIAKVQKPESIGEKIDLADKAEADISQYSINSARRALTNSDYEEAYKQFQALADSGNDEAQAHLGSLYYVGKGVNKDLEQAYYWYKKAADQGNVDAQYSVGNMYLLGEGVEQSNTDAAKWYRLASDQGHTAAKNNLRNLEKLEALNEENQMKLDALAAEQNTKEETVKENAVQQQEDINSIEANTTEASAAIKTEKPGFFSRLFGNKSDKKQAENDTEEQDITDEVSTVTTDESIVETKSVKTEAISTATASNEEEPNEFDSEHEKTDTSETNEEKSPGFFSRLFETTDESAENNADTVALETSDEISEVETGTIVPEEIVTTTEEETDNADEMIGSPGETTLASEEADSNEEKSPGFFSRLFGNSDEKKDVTEDIALIDSKTEVNTTKIEEAAKEEIAEDVSTLSEVEQIRPLATQGDAKAQYKLATLYYSGRGVKQDYSQAALWYRRAAQQGNVDAQYSLGNMYLMGEGIGQNDAQAAEWYALAAEQGHSLAKHNLANLKKTETPTSQIMETETDNTSQLISLDEEQAATTDDKSAKAIYEKALAYAFGDGVPQNDRTAFNLYYEAAEKGYVLAQYKLGVAFAYGEGVRQDNKQAAEWYRKAAEQGYTIAQRNLATMYLNGNGVEKNKVQALAWYEVVANAGNAMDLHRRDKLKSELSEVELNESLNLAKQISDRITNPSL